MTHAYNNSDPGKDGSDDPHQEVIRIWRLLASTAKNNNSSDKDAVPIEVRLSGSIQGKRWPVWLDELDVERPTSPRSEHNLKWAEAFDQNEAFGQHFAYPKFVEHGEPNATEPHHDRLQQRSSPMGASASPGVSRESSPRLLVDPLAFARFFVSPKDREGLDLARLDLRDDLIEMLELGHGKLFALLVIWWRSATNAAPFFWRGVRRLLPFKKVGWEDEGQAVG